MPDMVNGMSAGMKSTTPNIWKTTINMTAGMSSRIKSFTAQCNPLGVAAINQLKAGIANSGAQSSILSTVKTLTTKVINAFKNGFGIHSPSRVFFKLGNYIVQGFVNGLNSKDMGGFIKNWIGSITSGAGAMSANVSNWLTAALAITGTPISWLPGLQKLVSRESGGNPTAWNPISVGGQHATGLLQTLPSTFAAYAVKGLGNILNPIANAAAAINYIKSMYGSVYNTPLFKGGSYVGYAMGTSNAMPGIAQVAENGIELVVGRQFRKFKGGEKVLNNAQTKALIGGDGNPNVSVFVTVQGNMVGNEEYAESLGEYIYKKITDARRKL